MSEPRQEMGVIELRVREAAQLFNSMDPSPFPDRDLDQDAEEFIVGWADEYPRQVPLEVRVHLSQPTTQADVDSYIRDGIHNFFAYQHTTTRRRLRSLMARGRLSLIIGLAFLTLCTVVSDVLAQVEWGTLAQVVSEGLLVGGWVAMWRPMQTFLYDWWPLVRERRIYARLSRANVRVFRPENPGGAPGGEA